MEKENVKEYIISTLKREVKFPYNYKVWVIHSCEQLINGIEVTLPNE